MTAPPIKCTVCDTELRFIEYGHKIGKDGREAKWPIYEKCPNKENHREILRQQALEKEAQLASDRPAVITDNGDHKIDPNIPHTRAKRTGLLFRWENVKEVKPTAITLALGRFARRIGHSPISARCNLDHYQIFADLFERMGLTLPLEADLNLTPDQIQLVLDVDPTKEIKPHDQETE